MSTRQPATPPATIPFNPQDHWLTVSLNNTTVLIRLPCLPSNPEEPSSPRGIPAWIVLDACIILTRNQTRREGSALVYRGPKMFVQQMASSGSSSSDWLEQDEGLDEAMEEEVQNEAMKEPGQNEAQAPPPKMEWKTVAADAFDLLGPGHYEFYKRSDDRAFQPEICLSFRDWAPPPLIPRHWRRRFHEDNLIREQGGQCVVNQAARTKDKCCQVTRALGGTESCYLIPHAEAPWHSENGLGERAGDFSWTVDSPNNCITLRADLNKFGLDTGHFVFVPDLEPAMYTSKTYRYDARPPKAKKGTRKEKDGAHNSATQAKTTEAKKARPSTEPPDPPFMTFFMTSGALDLAFVYHRRQMTMPPRIPGEYIYSRFAYNVFLLVERFRKERRIAIGSDGEEVGGRNHGEGDGGPWLDDASGGGDDDAPGGADQGQDQDHDMDEPDGGNGSHENNRGEGSAGSRRSTRHPRGPPARYLPSEPPRKKAKTVHRDAGSAAALKSSGGGSGPAVEDRVRRAEKYDHWLYSAAPQAIVQDAERKGYYQGYSKIMRRAHEYRKDHPAVSAVVHARRVGPMY